MHAHNQTILSRLGFADPDKKSNRHDRACQYLALPDNAAKLLWMVWPSRTVPVNKKSWQEESEGESRQTCTLSGKPSFEAPVSKGAGQYKTTVGFLDLVWRTERHGQDQLRVRRNKNYYAGPGNWQDWSEWKDEESEWKVSRHLAVEVKITPVTTGEILRQINLYREYMSPDVDWIAATDFALPASEAVQLKDAKITHVRLGGSFNEYLARMEAEVEAGEEVSVEI